MIRSIYVSELDRTNLSHLKTIQNTKVDKANYAGVVVQKPWGYEYLMLENDFVAIWILHIKKNHGTSMHCHPRKKTSLVVLSGSVLTSTLTGWFEFKPLQGITYDAGVFHSTKALQEDTFIMEIETPPDKKDLVRLKDSYKRESQGYEGRDKYSRDLKKFHYITFKKKEIKDPLTKKLKNVYISLKKCTSNYLDRELMRDKYLKTKKIYSILEEKVIEPEHKTLFWPGAIFDIEHLKDKQDIRLYNNCLLLVIEQKKK